MLLVLAGAARAATGDPGSSAREWLALVDQHKYADAWKDGSAFFRSSIPERGWEGQVKTYRDAVGEQQRRDVDQIQLVAKLPNLPDGQYAVVRFHTTFSKKADSYETVNMIQEGDLWRVSSYTIR
jgi:hypothetical protein